MGSKDLATMVSYEKPRPPAYVDPWFRHKTRGKMRRHFASHLADYWALRSEEPEDRIRATTEIDGELEGVLTDARFAWVGQKETVGLLRAAFLRVLMSKVPLKQLASEVTRATAVSRDYIAKTGQRLPAPRVLLQDQ